MAFAHPLPAVAAFRHHVARDGFETVFVTATEHGFRLDGHTAAVEAGEPWAVGYAIDVDPAYRTRRATLTVRSRGGARAIVVEADGEGAWRVDGAAMPLLDGCLDLDLEASAFTNALPVRRFGLAIGAVAPAPAAYVRAVDLRVERLEQTYRRLADVAGRERYHYLAPRFDADFELVFDAHGVVTDYPGLAARVL